MNLCFIDTIATHDDPDIARIMDIGMVNLGGLEESFATDLNPEMEIPSFKSALTGLNKESSKRAPKFYQLAKRIVELTQNRVLVGYNMGFQYKVLQRMFSELGFPFQREWLDLHELITTSFPEHNGKELHHIAREFKIEYHNVHRSEEDVRLVEQLFQKMKKLVYWKHIDAMIQGYLPEPSFKISEFAKMSDKPSCYLIYNENKHLIYVGHARNTGKKIAWHLSEPGDSKSLQQVKLQGAFVHYEEEGSELVAMIKAMELIHSRQPILNPLHSKLFSHSIVSEVRDGITCLKVVKEVKQDALASFTSYDFARSSLSRLAEEFHLCPIYCDLMEEDDGPCYEHMGGYCEGICVNDESKKDYNQRVKKAIESLKFRYFNYVVVDAGRTPDERSLLWVENGKFKGTGYIENKLISKDLDLMRDFIEPHKDSKLVRQLIKNYLLAKNVDQVLRF